MGVVGGSATDIRKAFTRRSFLTFRNLVNFIGLVENVANSRCLSGYVYSVRYLRESVGNVRMSYSA